MAVVLLDNARDKGGVSTLFEEPFAILRADAPEDVSHVLQQLEEALKGGASAAGFFSYECGYCLEPKLAGLLPDARKVPLIWFGFFHERKKLQRGCVRAWLENKAKGGFTLSATQPSWDEVEYTKQFEKVQAYIRAGDIYQANLTFKAHMQFEGDAVGLYARLRAVQPVSYGAFIDADDFKVLSLSPEMFVSKYGTQLTSKPMKGTAPRGRWSEEDRSNAEHLCRDEKSQAENLMIVDLMRNDIGRISAIGSVKVPALFHVEAYRTLHQMTSTVTGQMKKDVGLRTFLSALFPPGSVTGAPKIRAQEVIAECEGRARGVYTGAIGMFLPDGVGGIDAAFNVAIRTLVIGADGQAEMGIGSGVVADSRAADEYRECLLKMKFLSGKPQPFQIIETMLWEEGIGFAFGPAHQRRMASSAGYLGISFDEAAYDAALLAWESQPKDGPRQRVRLLLGQDGTFFCTAQPLGEAPPMWRFALSEKRVDSSDFWLYHKTTQRSFWDEEREAAKAACRADEVLFLNEHGELTQGSITNIFLDRGDGILLTPALSCGLLPGILRESLLKEGMAIEAILTPNDLARAKAVYLGNSVRGLAKAEQASAIQGRAA